VSNLAFEAMKFAMEKHKGHQRKYTNNPYTDHLAEVAGIVSSVERMSDVVFACAWLHDVVEDRGVTPEELEERFGKLVRLGVMALSDLEEGNRAQRKALSRDRLSKCSGWIQNIKVADLISNTSSIVQHDPKFAVTYLEEKRLLLDVLTNADPRLLEIARQQIGEPS